MCTLFLAALSGCAGAHGCHSADAPAGAAPAQPPPPAATVQGPLLDDASVFELVATSEGALLLWAAGECQRGLSLQRFDADGLPLGAAIGVPACGELDAKARVTSLAAVAAGGKLGVAWVVRGADRAEVLGSIGDDAAGSLAAPAPLGAADVTPPAAQRQLLISGAETGQLRVMFRGPSAACTAQAGACAQVISTPLPRARQAAARRTDTREVPTACPQLLVGSAWNRGVWYDAFCALESAAGLPTTEVYSVRPEIFYAEALPTLRSCTPIGLAPSERGVIVLGACADGIYAHALSEAHRVVHARVQRALRCEAGRPILEIRARGDVAESYKLSGPRDRIELWLPESLAGETARAAFTGRNLLIAEVQGQRLTLSRQHCQGETLVSDTRTML